MKDLSREGAHALIKLAEAAQGLRESLAAYALDPEATEESLLANLTMWKERFDYAFNKARTDLFDSQAGEGC